MNHENVLDSWGKKNLGPTLQNAYVTIQQKLFFIWTDSFFSPFELHNISRVCFSFFPDSDPKTTINYQTLRFSVRACENRFGKNRLKSTQTHNLACTNRGCEVLRH